ncbi:MAG: malectin domain-containing carbohydrate-binding protein, partial [Bacteroidales bacterium]|nr:malectin domain-containing carbohydrate-binding protein [Bacteroidales bacterium]
EILAEPINWESDIDSPVYGTTYFSRTGSWSWDGTNNTSAPNKLFGPFRYDKAGDTEMQFAFPLSAKGRYEVKLFFAERNTEVDAGIKGTFNVFLENEKVLYNFNIYQNAAYEANVQSFDVLVEDQILNLDFQQILNSSKINGVEISYLDEGLPPRDSERITLKKYMITDLVDGGSRYSPLYLVNEQKRDPFSKKQPKSKSWLPSKHISNSPFHIMLDLGEEYFIDFAFLHDMKFTADLNISSGKPDHWIEIATYTTSSFKKWKEVDLNTTSRYLLFSMYNTIYAQINEIALYGYAINQTDKSNIILNSDDSPDFVIYPNPAKNRIQIQNKIDDQIVEILNINGKVLFRTQDNSIDIADIPNGIYLLRLYYYEEVIFQDRFIKND